MATEHLQGKLNLGSLFRKKFCLKSTLFIALSLFISSSFGPYVFAQTTSTTNATQKGIGKDVPIDRFGEIDWVKLTEKHAITPRFPLNPILDDSTEELLDSITLFETKSEVTNNVLFPHDIHTFWLSCENCHDSKQGAIFKKKAEENEVLMVEMKRDKKWCGRCHDRVAFSLGDCKRCHNSPKNDSKNPAWIIRSETPIAK